MDFDDYQKLANKTWHLPDAQDETALMYLGLGVTSEAGEVADKIKKVVRNDGGLMSEEKRQAILLEIGDVLWYLSQLARHFEVPFSEIAEKNIQKLADRAKRNVIASDGDTR
jgi:NTP pyrophosphatase (non-canonical NTP hydrolase)